MRYQLVFARSARKDLEALETKTRTRVLNALRNLQDEPRPRGSVKLRGSDHLHRIRIGIGEYRAIYAVDDGARVVDVIVIRHRRDAYR